MFNKDFFPTDAPVIEELVAGLDIDGKIILEPEGGKGDIVDFLIARGAREVIACENDPELKKILGTKCRLVGDDFLELTSDKISHIDAIVMNPPFSADEKHILHAYSIAPPGCKIRALCNSSTLSNDYSRSRKELNTIIENHGQTKDLGECFSTAERKTYVKVTLIKIDKPGEDYNTEFAGFFMDEDPKEEQANGIMSYNAVRDLVNRYVAAVKLYDQQLETGTKMNDLISTFYTDEKFVFQCTRNGVPKLRNEFKINLQVSAWNWIFRKMDLERHSTKGLREDINKFAHQQKNIPFTMKNIYHMLGIVAGTTGQRMDKAILEVFDRITEHHADNRSNVEGWKSNSHYMLGKKFILPDMCWQDQRWHKGESKIQTSGRHWELMEDFIKAICFITGENYAKHGSLKDWISYPYKTITDKGVSYHREYEGYHGHLALKEELYKKGIKCEMVHTECKYGEWFEWAYFRCKAFKKGSMHFEFKDLEVWKLFNQRVARLRGYPLYEGKEQTAYQKRNTGKSQAA